MNKQQSGSLHLTKKIDYGLFLLAVLVKQKKGEQCSIKMIAEENNIPFSFLQKIANELQKKGLIKSERGKYGGCRLAKSPGKITLKHVIEALEGPIQITNCTCTDCTPCDRSKFCLIKKGLQKMNKELEKFFLSKTLKDFIK